MQFFFLINWCLMFSTKNPNKHETDKNKFKTIRTKHILSEHTHALCNYLSFEWWKIGYKIGRCCRANGRINTIHLFRSLWAERYLPKGLRAKRQYGLATGWKHYESDTDTDEQMFFSKRGKNDLGSLSMYYVYEACQQCK